MWLAWTVKKISSWVKLKMSWWTWMLFLVCPHPLGQAQWNFFSQGQCGFNWRESCSRFLFWPPQFPRPYARWPSGKIPSWLRGALHQFALKLFTRWLRSSVFRSSVTSAWVYLRSCLITKTSRATWASAENLGTYVTMPPSAALSFVPFLSVFVFCFFYRVV